MFIKNINLKNFRNYENESIELINGINLFVGDNAQGKTNIIESVYVCAFSKSYRTIKDLEMIMFEKPYMMIDLTYNTDIKDVKQKYFINELNKKEIILDDVKIKKQIDVVGKLPIVIFSPDDLEIVKGTQSSKRKFLDLICCQLSKKYMLIFTEYIKILKNKNALLKKELSYQDKDYIYTLNEKLSEYIFFITKKRRVIIDELYKYSKNIIKTLTKEKENIELNYISEFENKNVEEIQNKLNSVLQYEIYRKTSLKGISKDIIDIKINEKDVTKYGSQGQKRTTLLTLKLASFEIIKENLNTNPILLLDDIMSELDNKRVNFLLNYIKDYQSIITTTEFNNIDKNLKINIKNVINGTCINK